MRDVVAQDRAQDLIEFALILPLLLILFLGIMEFGYLIMTYDTIANAAREGARLAVIETTPLPGPAAVSCSVASDPVHVAACRLTAGLDQDNLDVQVDSSDAEVIVVSMDYDAAFMTNVLPAWFGLSPTIPLHAEALMRREHW